MTETVRHDEDHDGAAGVSRPKATMPLSSHPGTELK